MDAFTAYRNGGEKYFAKIFYAFASIFRCNRVFLFVSIRKIIKNQGNLKDTFTTFQYLPYEHQGADKKINWAIVKFGIVKLVYKKRFYLISGLQRRSFLKAHHDDVLFYSYVSRHCISPHRHCTSFAVIARHEAIQKNRKKRYLINHT